MRKIVGEIVLCGVAFNNERWYSCFYSDLCKKGRIVLAYSLSGSKRFYNYVFLALIKINGKHIFYIILNIAAKPDKNGSCFFLVSFKVLFNVFRDVVGCTC